MGRLGGVFDRDGPGDLLWDLHRGGVFAPEGPGDRLDWRAGEMLCRRGCGDLLLPESALMCKGCVFDLAGAR